MLWHLGTRRAQRPTVVSRCGVIIKDGGGAEGLLGAVGAAVPASDVFVQRPGTVDGGVRTN